ncbi:hypothetical protein EII29_11390 [Leptotrichia sp. OH3620_COT-345]|uniref:hypothetical protein n=1 Tax=Leptotrichia sp. OH3620_COT-345 TaxID=2491048 RepID=UPI000F6465E3|nr:hypothetical protein [Leptotrichia sp. OH3620_COT-345]RRD36925.1 hypothetical protein EII29_11390 [Leptotrichia sp. OH3620_COT-345]
MKKIIMMIIIGIILGSCGELRYGIQKTIYEAEEEKYANSLKKKDGPGYTGKDKIIIDKIVISISNRSINKKVQFGETTLLIPENTRINPKVGNIVDEKTGYGIPITFTKSLQCMSKKIKDNMEYGLIYNDKNILISKIAQKIIKANDFKNTCN